MNKKFSTLMAAALLAGSFSVVAQTTTEWLPVTPAQLVNGAEYVIHNGDHSYSVIEGTAGNKSGMPYTDGQNCPLFGIPKADSDSIWTLTKVAGGFTLKSDAQNLFPIYLANKGLYTNVANSDLAVFTLGNDSTLSVTVGGAVNYVVAPSKKNGTTGFMVDENKESALKFAFFMKQDIPSDVTEDVIVANTPTLATTMYVIVDGKYVTLNAEGTDVSNNALEPGANNTSVWVYDNGKLRSYFGNKYLKIADQTTRTVDFSNGLKLTVTDKFEDAAQVSVRGQVVTFSDDVTNAVLATTDQVVPYNGNQREAASDASKVILYWDDLAYTVDGFESYSPSFNSTSAVWELKAVQTDKGQYVVCLANAEYTEATKNTYLTVDGEWVRVNGVDVDKDGKITITSADVTLKTMTSDNYVKVENNTLVATTHVYEAITFRLGTIQTANVTAGTLLKRYNEYFTLKIDYDKDGDNVYETILTDIFEGKLVPKGSVSYTSGTATFTDASPYATDFYLINEKKEVLVASKADEDVWSSGTTIHAYGLKLIPAHDFALDQQKPIAERNYMGLFSFEYTPGTEADEVTEITNIYVWEATSANSYTLHNIGCYMDKQTPVLAARGNATINKVRITLNPMALVDPTAWLTAPVYYNVEIANTDKKSYNYGKVLGMTEIGYAGFVDAENVDLKKPEGQFAITYDEENSEYDFMNRETKVIYSVPTSNLYTTEKENEFALNGDTLLITPVKGYKPYDGFKRFTAAELNANTYTVSMKLLNGDSLNIIENHNDKHRLGLDEENATDWRIAMSTIRVNDGVGDLVAYVPDTVTVDVPITYYVGGKWKTTTTDYNIAKYNANQYVYNPDATLKICAYLLQNTDNNEYLDGQNYEESVGNAYYVCNETEENATRIAFKLDGDGTVNLVPVYYGYDEYQDLYDWAKANKVVDSYYANYASQLRLARQKIIGGASSLTGVLKDGNRFKATTNDLFVINVAEAPTYKKLDQGSKIIISRVENNDEVIYEAGEFAGISNRAAYKDIKPTLYVDTAYVNRAGNFAYQYLLGVRINRVDTTYECNVPSHGIHRADTTFGYFLVNMIDSAKACTDVHKNKFVYNNEYKLAFVEGYRTNDTLYFTQNDKVVSKMEVGNGDYNIAKFAFKMIDEEANEFVIETGNGYNRQYTWNNGWEENVSKEEVEPGYLRWVNGNLVVTTDIEKAEHFTMEASDKEATANEEIATSSVIVAGVDGAVVVKGAEGKNVIVSTILGKVVANETVSSDNATIAAPQGVVVVSVDGESFKVVVK